MNILALVIAMLVGDPEGIAWQDARAVPSDEPTFALIGADEPTSVVTVEPADAKFLVVHAPPSRVSSEPWIISYDPEAGLWPRFLLVWLPDIENVRRWLDEHRYAEGVSIYRVGGEVPVKRVETTRKIEQEVTDSRWVLEPTR